MRRIKFWAIAIISFFSITAISVFHRAIAIFLCAVLGFNSNVCYWGYGDRVNAAIPPESSHTAAIVAQGTDIFRNDGGNSQQQQTDIFNNPTPQPSIDIFHHPNAPNSPRLPVQHLPTNRDIINSSSNSSRQYSFITIEPGKKYKINGISPDTGSEYTVYILVENSRFFVRSIELKFIINSGFTDDIYNIEMNSLGTQIDITGKAGRLKLEKLTNKWLVQFTDIGGVSRTWELLVLPEQLNKSLMIIEQAHVKNTLQECKEPGDEIVSRIVPDMLKGITDLAEIFKKLYVFFVKSDPQIDVVNKKKLIDEITKQTDMITQTNDTLAEMIECKPKPTQPQQVETIGRTGSSWGDPHLVTFDGFKYDHHTVGEFILTKSTDGAFELQVRETAVPGSSDVALNTAAAMKVGSTRVAFYAAGFPDSDTKNPLRVDGQPVDIQNGSLALSEGGSIAQVNQNSYRVQWPTGEQVSIGIGQFGNSNLLDVNPAVPDTRQGQMMGLLGDFNGNSTDDLKTREGEVLPPQQSINQVRQVAQNFANWIPIPLNQVESVFVEQLHKKFGDSWRISQQESLFDYAPGKNTDSFTNRLFPNGFRILRMLLPQQVQMAEQACRAANVGADRLEGCIFDVGATGNADFAKVAANAVTNIIKDRLQQEIQQRIPIPIRIPGLPF